MIKPIIIKQVKCPVCTTPVVGRKDKRYCCIDCKNKHHNDARSQIKSRIETSCKRLRRNLVLLDGIMGPTAKGMSIHRDELFKRGFDVESCTKAWKKNGIFYYELCEYIYFVNKNGVVVVRRTKEVSFYMPGFFERYEIDFPKGWMVNSEKDDEKGLDSSKLGRWIE